jgi:hypothetical protein
MTFQSFIMVVRTYLSTLVSKPVILQDGTTHLDLETVMVIIRMWLTAVIMHTPVVNIIMVDVTGTVI